MTCFAPARDRILAVASLLLGMVLGCGRSSPGPRSSLARTRTFAATLLFDNPGDVSLASGMTAKIRIHVSGGLSGDEWGAVSGVALLHDGMVVSRAPN